MIKKIYLIIFIIILGGLAFSIDGESDRDEPEILSVSALPQKVKVGDILTITAETKDRHGIEKVSAIMPFENGADEIQLSLISGNNKSGKWQAEWKCHNTINIEYITTVTAINVLGKSATKEVSWWDDTETVWLSGWNHRKKITFNNATPSANYQVKVDLTTGIMGDPYSNVQTDGDDIRFVQADGTNLDYWIETWSATGNSTLWVEVATISTSTIYMYYGNPSASSASNGTNTFEFFDDFEGASIDSGKWDVLITNVTISTDQAFQGYKSAKFSDSGYLQKTLTHSDNIAIKYWSRCPSSNGFYYMLHGDATSKAYGYVDAEGDIQYHDGSWHDTGVNVVANQWKSFEIRDFDWSSHTQDVVYDGLVVVNDIGQRSGSDCDNLVAIADWGGATFYIDCFLVRKYATTEPTATVATDEEKRPGAPGVNPSGGGIF